MEQDKPEKTSNGGIEYHTFEELDPLTIIDQTQLSPEDGLQHLSVIEGRNISFAKYDYSGKGQIWILSLSVGEKYKEENKETLQVFIDAMGREPDQRGIQPPVVAGEGTEVIGWFFEEGPKPETESDITQPIQ